MSQALYRKWRPQTWEAVVGQEHVVQTLRNSLAAGRVAHAYLFAGPRGTGKTTTARLLAKAVNCLSEDVAGRPCGECDHCQAVTQGRFLDLIEIDAASNTSVEDVRDLRDKIGFSPNQGRYKVYIIDEVHMLSTAAFNALLKTLEEPPSHAIFILATTEAHKIPATVLSRCQRHEFRRIPVNDIVNLLKTLAKDEGIEVEEEAYTLMARQSTGAMRDAVSLLDQLASTGQKITIQMAQEVLGTAANQAVLDVIDALVTNEPAAGLDQLHQALDAGSDPRQFARQIVEYLRDLLLIRMGNSSQVDAPAEIRVQMARHAQQFTTPELLRVIRAFNHAATEARPWQPALPLEMAFVEALSGPEPAPAAPSTTTAPAPRPAPAATTRPAASRPPEPPSEAEAETAQPEQTSASPRDAELVKQVVGKWKEILNLVRQRNPNTYGLINSFKTRSVHNGTLVLGFYDVLKSKMEKDNNLEMLREVLRQVLGEEIDVQCVVTNAKGGQLPSNVDNDGMVATAVNDLGGEVVDVQ